MENVDLMGFLVITLNCNVTIVGKIWLIFTVLLRTLVVVLAGYPIYQDEQERFVCNTLQPGCTNVCYDIFSPVSHLRFWLIQSVSVLLPYAVFSVYVLHRAAQLALLEACGSHPGARGHHPSEGSSGPRSAGRTLSVPDFSLAYIVHLFLRSLMEAGFGALHYLLFGFSVPKRFSCTRSPCSSVVDCYVSRPTEKFIMMLFIGAASALSFLLGAADLIASVRRRTRRRPGPAQGAPSSSIPSEHATRMSLPGHAEGPGTSQSLGTRPGQRAEDGGWEGVRVATVPGEWSGGQGTNSPSGKSGVSGQVEFPDEEESEVMSSASDKLAMGPRGGVHKQSGEQLSAFPGHLAGHYSSSQLQSPGRLAISGSAPHLRTKKSEWV
uniref:Gap junction protein n=1 Tax=Castor canadensis TaxID=51338 RepID=A0A8B7WB28_CASCN|nr:gap junction delta-4 protein [Castor canadensis]